MRRSLISSYLSYAFRSLLGLLVGTAVLLLSSYISTQASPGPKIDLSHTFAVTNTPTPTSTSTPTLTPESCTVWELAADFEVAPDAENPNDDACGRTGVWHYLEGAEGERNPLAYSPLEEFIENTFDIPGLQQWQATSGGSSTNSVPAIGINSADTAHTFLGVNWPSQRIRVHPSTTELVIVGWRSPVNGEVAITGGADDMDDSAGNGINWFIDKGSQNLASGSFENGGTQIFQQGDGGANLASVHVTEGEFIYFVVDPRGDYTFDSTQLDISIELLAAATPTPTPTITPTPTNTPTPTTVVIPTDTAITLRAVIPAQGRIDRVTPVEIYGTNLHPTFTYWLGTTPIPVIFIDGAHVSTKIPAGLPTGAHALLVRQGDQTVATLLHAFTVVDNLTVNDLLAEAVFLWSDPVAPRAGDVVQLGLIVQRQGGVAAVNLVQVRFEVQQAGQAPAFIAAGIVPALGVDDSASTMSVGWMAPSSDVYTLTAIIDPANQVVETDEGNNQVARTLTVLPPAADIQPPVIDSFLVNQGNGTTNNRTVALATTAHEAAGGSGLGRVMYVEMHWNGGAQAWVPVQFTTWLPYGQEHSWQLHPSPGMRYLQVWVADLVGNISAVPVKTLVSYIPSADSLLAGETRILRLFAQAGQCLRITVTPASGDPDLYVWPPGYQAGQMYWYSINGPDQPDSVELAVPTAGQYQVEVDGVTATEFGMAVTIAESCGRASTGQASTPAAKTPRPQPAVSTASEPAGTLALPEQTITASDVYLPSVSR